MDEDTQRAILLKAVMQVLGQQKIRLKELHTGKPDNLSRRFTQFNARKETLREGLEPYANTVRELLEKEGSKLELPAGRLWEEIYHFALGEPEQDSPDIPFALKGLQHWRLAKLNMREHITRDMGGYWWICRLSSKGGSDRQVTVSLLNIRPEFEYERRQSRCVEFTLSSQEGNGGHYLDTPPLTVHGICRQHNNQLHFLGLLDNPDTPLPTAMVLHYEYGQMKGGTHRKRSEGVLFTTNSRRVQIGCPIVARYVTGSAQWGMDEYERKREELVLRLGSHEPDTITDIIDAVGYRRLLDRSQKEMVYESIGND